MRIFRRVLVGVSVVVSCLGVQSCRQDQVEPTSQSAQANEVIYKEGDIELPLYGSLGVDLAQETGALKALSATVGNQLNAKNRLPVDYGQKFPVVCIIRSNQNDPITYIDNVEAVKQPDGSYLLNKERVHLAAGSSLGSGKKWYMMVVTQNSFNKNNGELAVNANGDAETLTAGTTRVLDIPSASAWIELPTFDNGQPKWPKDWTAARKQAKLTLYPQGVLCRATLRLDESYKAKLGTEGVDLKITQLKVVSTALSFAGKFKFDKASLPPLTQTSGRPTLTWVPTQTESAVREYKALDANTAEYQKVFNAPAGGAVLQVNGSSSVAALFSDSNSPAKVENAALKAGVQSLLFWAVPVKGGTNRHTTLIAETGSSSSAKVLQPSHTYIYGKKHTKDAGQGSVVAFDAVYYNPYTPLDYMAEYNMQRLWPNQFRPGGWIPQGPSNVLDTSHGVNSYTFLPWWDVEKTSVNVGGRHYASPNRLQWNSIIPFYGKAVIDMVGGNNVDNDNVSVQVGTIEGNTTFSSRIDTKKKVRYALALTGLAGGQKYRTAYRYAMEYGAQREVTTPYLELQKEVITRNVQRGTPPYIKDRNTFEPSNNIAYARFQWLVMKIEAVQLGAGFVGSVDDIANEDFWTNTANQRKEVRILPANYTAYRAYLFPSYIDPSVGRRVREDLYKGYNLAWGASYEARPNEPTAFYLGDDYLAIFDAPNGRWGIVNMRDNPRYVGIRFPVRPFTVQSR